MAKKKYTPKPGFTFSPGPDPEALRYFKAKKLKPGFDYRDVWREERAHAFTVAKAMNLDILSTFKDAIESAITDGKPLHQFKKDLTPTLQKQGWWGIKDVTDPKTGKKRLAQLGSPRRLRVIYQTNLATAHSAGRWERIQRTKKTHPYLLYRVGPSVNHREKHLAWNGLLLPVDADFWLTHYPPNGWGCKCYVRAQTKRQAKARGGPGKPPPIKRKPWKNTRTGKTEMVPEGLDPGWDTNAGIERLKKTQRHHMDKLLAAPAPLAAASVRDLVKSGGMRLFLDKPKGFLPVMHVSDSVTKAIGGKSNLVVFSEESARKNLKHHPELTEAEYELLPEIGERPTVAIQDGENTVVLVKKGERIYWAAVKAAKTGGEENFLTSFRHTNEGQVRRLLKKGRILTGNWEE